MTIDDTPNPRKIAKEKRTSLKEGHTKIWKQKQQHGYLFRKQESQLEHDKKHTNKWLKDRLMTSHIEGYICAIQEQEIKTKLLENKRENPEVNPKCRYCKVSDESIFHILNSCSQLSASLYLPVRHNEVAKIVYYELIQMYDETVERKKPIPTYRTSTIEVWWDKKISVQPPAEFNKPDIVFWDLQKKKCIIIDICVPLDVNANREEKVKSDKYLVLATGLQRLYPTFKYDVIPIVVGSTGFISKNLTKCLEKCGFERKTVDSIIPELQRKALRGSMKIVKTALKMK